MACGRRTDVLRRPPTPDRAFATMRAAVLPGDQNPAMSGRITMPVRNVEMPRPKQGEVLIRNAAAGVCHTDLHIILGHIPFPKPAVVGHELVGEVVEIGPDCPRDLHALEVGERAIGTFIMPCGTCPQCTRGEEDVCETFFAENRLKGCLLDGTTRLQLADEDAPGGCGDQQRHQECGGEKASASARAAHGHDNHSSQQRAQKPGDGSTALAMYSMAAFAEYSVVPYRAVHRLPRTLPYLESCIIGCALFTGYGAAKNGAELAGGERVVIFGVGGVGSNLVQICKALGAAEVVAVDVCKDRLQYAMQVMGANSVVHVEEGMGETDVVRAVGGAFAGRSPDVAFEVVGSAATARQAVLCLGAGGKAVLAGLAKPSVEFSLPLTHMVRRKIQVRGTFGAKATVDTPELLERIRKGEIKLDAVPPENRYTLNSVGEAYEELYSGNVTGKAIVVM
eukprot:g8973.t1